MYKIRIPSDIYQDNSKLKNMPEQILEINDNLFEIAFSKGLIEKNNDEYIFIGDEAELLAFTNKGELKKFDWLDWI